MKKDGKLPLFFSAVGDMGFRFRLAHAFVF